MTHGRLYWSSAGLSSVFDPCRALYQYQSLSSCDLEPQIKRHLQLSVTTNHHLSWSDIWERGVQLNVNYSVPAEFFMCVLTWKKSAKQCKPQTACGDQRHSDIVVWAALLHRTFTHFSTWKKYNAASSVCSSVIKASRSNLFNQDFLLLSQELNFKVTVHAVT